MLKLVRLKAVSKGYIMPGEFIFVYGSLRKETSSSMSQVLLSHCEYVSHGHIKGKMYMVNWYPGVVESDNPEDIVYGEIYSISRPDTVLPLLDEYEECSDKFPQPHEYVRKKVPVSVPDSGSISAWVYIYSRDVSGLKRIKSSDYFLP